MNIMRMANTFYSTKFEDTIQCSFFPISTTQTEDVCNSINKTIDILSKDYIWHRDEFKICVSEFDDEKKGMPVHLTSTTCFGENIEDEWFIVYLVFEITSLYPDLVVQIEDNDGDFLLIEAADFLPSWANPNTTKNRVFIYQNKVHIISPEVVSLDSKIDLQNAIHIPVQKSHETIASTEIQEAVLKRISSYPQKIKESQHRALVTLPVDIAALLTVKPSLIAPIVTTFCTHDILDSKSFENVKLEQCVTVPILFTKYLYAMLMHCNVPRISKFPNSSCHIKDIALGWKLACGYEIIMSKSSSDIFTSSEYTNFLNRLTKNGYFRDNIKGSKHYNEQLEKAKDYFSHIECNISSYYCYNIGEIKATGNYENVRQSIITRGNMKQMDVDSDDWLNVNPEELNTFLNTHYGKTVLQSHAPTNSQITTDLAHFFNKTSDFEGIEYEEEEKSDINQIDFDSDQFINCVQKMLSIVSGNDDDAEDFENDLSEADYEISDIEEHLDKELASKLNSSDKNIPEDEYILNNLLQSIKEEGISGPSSNVLKNIDVSKIDLLDSDDD